MKGTKNIKANIFSKKVKLQGDKSVLKTILKININRKIKYNHL